MDKFLIKQASLLQFGTYVENIDIDQDPARVNYQWVDAERVTENDCEIFGGAFWNYRINKLYPTSGESINTRNYTSI